MGEEEPLEDDPVSGGRGQILWVRGLTRLQQQVGCCDHHSSHQTLKVCVVLLCLTLVKVVQCFQCCAPFRVYVCIKRVKSVQCVTSGIHTKYYIDVCLSPASKDQFLSEVADSRVNSKQHCMSVQ